MIFLLSKPLSSATVFTSALLFILVSSSIVVTHSEITQSGSSQMNLSAVNQKLDVHGLDTDPQSGYESINLGDDLIPENMNINKSIVVENSGNVDMIYNLSNYGGAYDDSTHEPYYVESMIKAKVSMGDDLIYDGSLPDMDTVDVLIKPNERHNLELNITWDETVDIRQLSSGWLYARIFVNTSLTNGDKGFMSRYNLGVPLEANFVAWTHYFDQWGLIPLSATSVSGNIWPEKKGDSIVEYSTDPSFAEASRIIVGSTDHYQNIVTVDGLTPDTTYYFRVKPANSDTIRDDKYLWSDTVTVTTPSLDSGL